MAPRPLPPAPSPEWASVTECIRTRYTRGGPFITRHILQRVAMQISLYQAGMLTSKPFILYDMNNHGVSVEIDPDKESPIFRDMRCNHGDRKKGPYIYYRSIQVMLSHRDMRKFDAEMAFLPLVIMFPATPGRCHNHHTHDENKGPESFYPSELTTILNIERQSWEESEEYGHLKAVLKTHTDQLSKIDRVIGFGCGTLADGRTRCQFSATQHALIFSLQRIISKMHPENNKVRQGLRQACNKDPVELVVRGILQDPAYTDTDKAVLKGMGMEVMGDPCGFLEMDENSFVVSIDLNTPAQQIIENLARPAALIRMTHVEEFNGENAGMCTDPSSSRVDKMLREEYDLVKLKYHPNLRNICMYIKKPRT
ncbi:uncharacterized protein GGS22DRAFT_181534 [Annulohypoxylon maeteangense]|uniref:uncharacterized protein n=1 Tax=Annulohypoxylon maeteangense TaxID=1927788 RepID=UPI002008481E|nr:uncharacterized protein GGS22DRAFT_181534 [Annulohypoxylon maeteangense]KAI0881759.1 hypothetical protein GGS22DRAFT_181534 [Annulohypoxylon maeteangense]